MIRSPTSHRWPSIAIGAIVLLAVLWVAMGVTVGLVLARRDTDIVVPGWHTDVTRSARAEAIVLSEAQLPAPSQTLIATAKGLALTAVRRDPTNASATRTLGVIAALEQRKPEARRWMVLSQYQSRRDLSTQLWMIEDAVTRSDIPDALRHYNYALMTNRSAEALLFPVLIAGSADTSIRMPLARLLAGRPLWWARFIDTLIATGTVPSEIAELTAAPRLNIRVGPEQQLAARAVQRLLQLDDIDHAHALFVQLRGKEGKRLLRDGNFTDNNPIPPFDWSLSDKPELYASIGSVPDERYPQGLSVASTNGSGGVAAQQLLRLPQGRYLLSLVAGGGKINQIERPKVQLSCRGNTALPLASLPLPATGEGAGHPLSAAINVPANSCRFQQIEILVPGIIDEGAVEGWVSAITLRPR